VKKFGYIYVIEAGPYFKIGKALDWKARSQDIIRGMKGHEPKLPLGPIRLMGVCACWASDLSAIERALHKRFDEVRALGEWFMLSLEQLEWIFTQEEIPMWEDTILWEYAKDFDLDLCIPCPS
jgi:hypothetical protein